MVKSLFRTRGQRTVRMAKSWGKPRKQRKNYIKEHFMVMGGKTNEGLWLYVRFVDSGEGGPCLTSAAAMEIIPPIIQDVFPCSSKHSAASLYDLRKLSVLFYCGDLTTVSVYYGSAGKRDCYFSQPESMTSGERDFKDLSNLYTVVRKPCNKDVCRMQTMSSKCVKSETLVSIERKTGSLYGWVIKPSIMY